MSAWGELPGKDPMTPREAEVAALVAEGLSNPDIASRLHISHRTVASHVTHVLVKLGFSSRVQIASWVTRERIVDQLFRAAYEPAKTQTPDESQRGCEAQAREGQVMHSA